MASVRGRVPGLRRAGEDLDVLTSTAAVSVEGNADDAEGGCATCGGRARLSVKTSTVS